MFFGYLFIVEMDPKDEMLLKKEFLPCKNIIFAYKGNLRKYKGQAGAELCQAHYPLCLSQPDQPTKVV